MLTPVIFPSGVDIQLLEKACSQNNEADVTMDAIEKKGEV